MFGGHCYYSFVLSVVETGQLCKFIVNTVNAGSGALAVTIDGPSKVQLSCHEVEEGYEFTYTPMAPGDYLITIKYAGNTHIPGSPFRARIEGTTFLLITRFSHMSFTYCSVVLLFFIFSTEEHLLMTYKILNVVDPLVATCHH